MKYLRLKDVKGAYDVHAERAICDGVPQSSGTPMHPGLEDVFVNLYTCSVFDTVYTKRHADVITPYTIECSLVQFSELHSPTGEVLGEPLLVVLYPMSKFLSATSDWIIRSFGPAFVEGAGGNPRQRRPKSLSTSRVASHLFGSSGCVDSDDERHSDSVHFPLCNLSGRWDLEYLHTISVDYLELRPKASQRRTTCQQCLCVVEFSLNAMRFLSEHI